MDLNHIHRIIILVYGISLRVSANKYSNHVKHEIVGASCEPGWHFFGEKYYKIHGFGSNALSWEKSKEKCSSEGGHLASIHSKELQEFLTRFLLIPSETNVWIGLNDLRNESHFSWEDGSNLNYTNWDANRPILDRKSFHKYEYDCVGMRYSGYSSEIGAWTDQPCFVKQPYLCQVNKERRFCICEECGGWKYLNSCYHIVYSEKSWEDSEKYCKDKFMGHLVTISDWKREEFINNILKTHLPIDFWIGIQLQNTATQKWASGWHVTYNKWDKKPLHVKNGTCILKSRQNSWEVSPCLNKYPFICEKSKDRVPQRPPSDDWKCPNSSEKWLDLEGDSCFYIETEKRRNWHEARDECVKIGGILASFHSEEETNILNAHTMDIKRNLFIGLKRISVNGYAFNWVDGSEFVYQNWLGGMPNILYEGRSFYEGCVHVRTENMKWQVVPCSSSRGYICKSKKVFSKMEGISTPEFSEFEEFSTPVPFSSVVSIKQTYSGGNPAGTVAGIVLCTILIVLLAGVIV